MILPLLAMAREHPGEVLDDPCIRDDVVDLVRINRLTHCTILLVLVANLACRYSGHRCVPDALAVARYGDAEPWQIVPILLPEPRGQALSSFLDDWYRIAPIFGLVVDRIPEVNL